MTGSQDYLTPGGSTTDYLTAGSVAGSAPPVVGSAPAPPQQHSPASTSSSGSAGYTNAATRPPVIPHMGWESPGGTTHFTTPPTFQYEPCYPMVITPMNGGPPQDGVPPAGPPPPLPPQCMNGDTGRGNVSGGGNQAAGNGPPPTLHFHVKPGDPVQLPPGAQVPPGMQGAMVHWVCNIHDHPIPLGPPGHYILNDNGMMMMASDPAAGGGMYPPPGPPPYTNGTTPPWNNQYYMSPPPPGNSSYMHPHQQQPQHQQFYPVQGGDPNSNTNMPPTITGGGRPSKPPFHKHKNRERMKSNNGSGMNNGGVKSTGSTSPSLSVQSTPPQSPVKPRSVGGSGGGGMNNGGVNHNHYHHHHGGPNMYSRRGPPPMMMMPGMGGGGGHHIGEDSEESGIGNEPDEDQDEKELYIELLSNIRTPQVSGIMATQALLIWSPPVSDPGDSRFEVIKPIQPKDLDYEVKLSDKGKDGKYRSIYYGESLNCQLTDLRPNTEYHVRVQANLKSRNLKGGTSDTVSFLTNCTVPDQPQPPKLTQRGRQSLHLRWNAPADNGKHILHYVIESDLYTSEPDFKVVYEGRAKQCNVTRLQPQTVYRFRLAAVNELGSSPYSEVMTFATQGSPPSQPQPPKLNEVTESSLQLLWSKRPCDDEFTLQMEDPSTGHGFLSQYNGIDTDYTVTHLENNTTYRFKLRAHNEMGASAYSRDIAYTTNPGRPHPPTKPQVKGKVRARSCKVIWNPPDFTGGSPIISYELEMDGGSGYQSVYRGEDTEFLFDELQPGTTYRVRVACVSAGGVGDYSETCFVNTDPVAPGPPSPPQLVEKPKNKLPGSALQLIWTAPEYDGGAIITDYEIDMTTPDNSTKGVYRGRNTECIVASLLPGRPYLFQVRAYNRAGPGSWSQPLETISGAGPPDKPRDPKGVVKSGTMVNISWDQPINNGAIITGYLLQMACVCEALASVEEAIDSDSDFSDVEDDLNQDGEDQESQDDYESEDNDAESVYNDETTDDEVEDSTTTTSTKTKSNSCSSPNTRNNNCVQPQARATKSAVHCDTEELEVDEQDGGGETSAVRDLELDWKLVYSGQERQVDVKDMTPATQYQFKVCAMNSAGGSPYSGAISLDMPTSAPGVPHTLITHNQPTSTCIAFKWKKPSANGEPITGYRIEWSAAKSSAATSELLVTRRCLRLDNLKPDTAYTIRVQAINAKGQGPLSAPLKASTKPLPPAPPRLECVSVSHNMLKLKWIGADGKNSLLSGTSYVLECENSRKTWFSVYNGIGLSFKHNKLAEDQDYSYRIRGTSEAGQGPFSYPVTFHTSYAPPAGLKVSTRVSAVTETGCLLQWSQGKGKDQHQNQDQLHYKVLVSRGKDCSVASDTYQVQADTQLRLSSLASRTEYTVRVVSIRNLPGGKTLEGPPSPPTSFSTLAGQMSAESRTQSAGSRGNRENHHQSDEHRGNRRTSASTTDWSDKKYAAVILSGFTLFAIFVAMIIQQLISFGAISS